MNTFTDTRISEDTAPHANNEDAFDNSENSIVKRAVQKLANATPGVLIPTAEYDHILEMPALPSTASKKTYGEWDIRRMKRHKAVQDILLETYKRDLQNSHGKGYQIIASDVQAGVAAEDFTKSVRKELKRQRNRITHVDTSELTATQRKDLTDQQAKTALLEHKIKEGLKETKPFRKPVPEASTTPFRGKWAK